MDEQELVGYLMNKIDELRNKYKDIVVRQILENRFLYRRGFTNEDLDAISDYVDERKQLKKSIELCQETLKILGYKYD